MDVNLEPDSLDVTEAQQNFTALIEDITTDHRQKVIVCKGKPAVVLINVSDYQALLDKMLVMELETGYHSMKEAEKRGELIELNDLAATFGFSKSDFTLLGSGEADE